MKKDELITKYGVESYNRRIEYNRIWQKANKREKIKLKCDRCNHIWNYGGKNEVFALCPKCRQRIRIARYTKDAEFPHLNINDKNYLAGFFDGECCISIIKSTGDRSVRPLFSVSNTNEEVMIHIGNIMPFDVHISSRKRNENQKRIFEITVHSYKLRWLLTELLPFLIVKKEQAKLAIELQTQIDRNIQYKSISDEERENREDIRRRIMKINGWNWQKDND